MQKNKEGSREEDLLRMRPQIPHIQFGESRAEEHFQNETLRPIIKWQNALLVFHFKAYAIRRSLSLNELSRQKLEDIIEQALSKDAALRNQMLGIVIGFFTLSEYEQYLEMDRPLNRRIIQMIKERLKDQLSKKRY